MTEAQYFPYLKYNWISDDSRVHACAQMLSSERSANNNPLRNRGLDLSEAFNVILTSIEVWHSPNFVDTLEAQWSLLKTFEIKKFDGSRMPWSDLFYHQSTKGKLLRGGRVYAPFCVYPKTERLGITINGDPVGSLDLIQIHPTLLLAMEGLQSEQHFMDKDAPEDAYSMPDYQEFTRGHNKILVNILFNAKSEDAAARAFLNTYYWHDPLTNEERFKTYKGKTKNLSFA